MTHRLRARFVYYLFEIVEGANAALSLSDMAQRERS